MKLWLLASLSLVGLTLACSNAPEEAPEPEPVASDPATMADASCSPVGPLNFICGVIGPEDLAVIPESDWVVASGNQEGGRIHLVSISNKATQVAFPSAETAEQLDGDTYPTCPGPIDPSEGDQFRAHGLYLRPGDNATHTLYVVHHGFRESIEVFEVAGGEDPPRLTWVGCAVTPEGTVLNSVVGLPDGGFATTATTLEGDVTSGVLEWQTETGWMLVPGSDDIRPNGLEVSDDGAWLYVAGWQDERVIRLSRGQPDVQKDMVQIGFRPDNLRRAPDGRIYAAGHTNFQEPSEAFNVAWIDPETLEFERILQHPVIEGFAASTTAIPIADELWLGTNRGRMIGYMPRP